VLAGLPEAAPWTPLAVDEEAASFYAGKAEIELYRSEAENYRSNLASAAPSIWMALQETRGDPPYAVATVTADPAEGEGLTVPAQGIAEAVAMPASVRQAITAFVAVHHVDHIFKKRTRDRANPEALARRGPRFRDDHER
jgi:hypothetical protein